MRLVADDVQAMDAPAFLARLQHAFGWRVGRLLTVGERSRYAAIGLLARELHAQRAVLVGNAEPVEYGQPLFELELV